MDRLARKEALIAYKQRKPAFGIFAVVCRATGDVWVGRSTHIDTQQNGLWFGLSHGGSPYASLQASWRAHGAAAFTFEELERLRDDFPEHERKDELKKRQDLWRARLQAAAL